MTDLTTEEKRPHNNTLAIDGVSSPLDSFVVAESFVLRTNFVTLPFFGLTANLHFLC